MWFILDVTKYEYLEDGEHSILFSSLFSIIVVLFWNKDLTNSIILLNFSKFASICKKTDFCIGICSPVKDYPSLAQIKFHVHLMYIAQISNKKG